jgi:energy-converting hydrogenase A subunit M
MENEFRKFAEWLLRNYQHDDEHVDSLARQLKSDVDFWFTANRDDLQPLRKHEVSCGTSNPRET